MTSQFAGLVIAFGLGLLTDRFRIWPLVLTIHLLMVASISLFVRAIPEGTHIYTKDEPSPILLDIGFFLCHTVTSFMYPVNQALITKAISNCMLSRGVLLGAQGMAMSFGVLLIDGLGGEIYKNDKRNPFFIVLSTESFAILLIIVLALFKQLRI